MKNVIISGKNRAQFGEKGISGKNEVPKISIFPDVWKTNGHRWVSTPHEYLYEKIRLNGKF